MGSRSLRAFLSVLACLIVGAIAFTATAAANAVQPYGWNDAGGFRDVLPPGENGLDNLPQVLAFKATKTIPPHYDDQQPLYENLLYGAPTLTDEAIPNYFKDATFGVPANEVESQVEPKPGVTILRDKAYGVPHIYGETRA
ncbi:MAG: penicillin acylase family protein, partial [Actinobacteria bacterium]|nr:penicillin acylase family protein [Actinomycetota bacterium]